MQTQINEERRSENQNLYTKSRISNHIHRDKRMARESNQLYKAVLAQFQKNCLKYKSLLNEYPNLSFSLYTPNLKAGSDLIGNHQLMDNQLSRLIDDTEKLDKQINKMSFQVQHKKQSIMKSVGTQNIFEFLRTAWRKRVQAEDSEEHLEQINRKIGNIKGQLKKMISQQNSDLNANSFEDIVKGSSYYLHLESQYNKLQAIHNVDEQLIKSQKLSFDNLTRENQKLKRELYSKNEKETNIKKTILTEKSNPTQNLNQIIYWHKSKKFQIKINSELLGCSQKIQTKKTLNDIQKFLNHSIISQAVKPVDLTGFIEGDWNKNLGSLFHTNRNTQKRKGRMDQLNEQETDNEKTLIDQVTDDINKLAQLDDIVSADGKRKRFFRSPKVEKQRYGVEN